MSETREERLERLRSRQERLKQKSTQAAVLNSFGLGSSTLSTPARASQTTEDATPETGPEARVQAGSEAVQAGPEAGVGPPVVEEMMEEAGEVAVEATPPGPQLFSAPPETAKAVSFNLKNSDSESKLHKDKTPKTKKGKERRGKGKKEKGKKETTQIPESKIPKAKKTTEKHKKLTALQRKIRLMKQVYSMYPDKKKSKKPGSNSKVPLRSRLNPGRIVILVAGRQRYRGSRMVFVKQLESGHLLLAGPSGLNHKPLMPILPAFVIATSTKLELSDDVIKHADKITFSMFKTEKKRTSKDSGIFTDSATDESAGPRIDPAVEKDLDDALMKCVDNFSQDPLESKIFVSYLRKKFTIKEGQYPHAMKF